tara:strand:+ start:475 stop:870 length:396 start_codon:yes stop_codon:yes gene_type:complete
MYYKNLAILILRLGIGFMFILHGWPKFIGGPEKWINLGEYGMNSIGIYFAPLFWGFMAAFAEFFGGIHLILGLFTRFFSLLLFLTMLVAMMTHISNGIMEASHAIESSIIFSSIFFMGAGKYSLDYIIFNK